ncbi:hypothetical protein [Vibrio sp. 99-70-13A1]|uniref:hypothetical protein n=1 Tax=Vibrio sp. 99-70-13A1 TaxID=2607601 RepID=UPI0014939D6A|nr:hypothetical protein [Vibrio sp. 99-70-13A1]NOH96028.1 hypothetical protein [Vibrio sp. 99-70-13A1]
MAVQPKHQDRHGKIGFEDDFTSDQRQRFTHVANKAVHRRDQKQLVEDRFLESAKKAAFKPVVKSKSSKPNKARQVIWIIMIGLISLWAMYMTN